LRAPIGYWNAQAAFFLLAIWPAIALAANRTLPSIVRAACVAAASASLAGWLLTQSKGAGVALAISTLVFFAIAPQRLRALLPAAIAAVPAALAYDSLVSPFAIYVERSGMQGEPPCWLLSRRAS